jgi:tetratricopeptide (TPR) repeat protein
MKNNIVFVGILALIIITLGGGFWFTTKDKTPSGNVETTVHAFDTSIEQPDINKELEFPAEFPADALRIVKKNTETLRSVIESNPTDFGAWLDLAIQYKTINDYEHAAKIWEYLAEASPTQSVQFNNLGNIYHFFLKDFEKSEENYFKAIENSPEQTIYYIGLHELYKYSHKQDTSLAEDILLEGIEKTVNPIDLINTLARYYKDQGDIKNAKKYFEDARDRALKLGNKDLADKMQAEINFLK